MEFEGMMMLIGTNTKKFHRPSDIGKIYIHNTHHYINTFIGYVVHTYMEKRLCKTVIYIHRTI